MIKLLIVEDDDLLRKKLIDHFLKGDFSVFSACNYLEGKAFLSSYVFDIILLDVVLPDGSGFDLLQNLGENNGVPVVIMSDLSTDENILNGFELGAIDYIVKPCNLEILEKKIRLRIKPESQTLLTFGKLIISARMRLVRFDGAVIALTPTEFNILYFLAKNSNTIFSTDEIYEAVWHQPSLKSTTIKKHLCTLRNKLNESGTEFIKTIFGKGYMFQYDE